MKKNNEIYFRASGIGSLMVTGRGSELTENQKTTLNDLEARNNGEGKPLTENQKNTLNDLKMRLNRPPELSDTAKQYIKKMWLLNECGFYENLDNKYVEKGLLNEYDGIEIANKITNQFFLKNKERIYKNNITGEADAFIIENDKKIVIDIKCSWNALTFMNAELTNLYEWQLRCYMYLYDVDEAWLCYALTDTPDHLVNNEKKKIWYKYYNENMSMEEVEEMDKKINPIYEQIERNMVYSNNPAYKPEEMMKIFKIYRDSEKENLLLSKIPQALEYYDSITLNGKN